MNEHCTGWFPFWFWNDLLTEDEIRWQIAEMATQGLRGFVPSPRQGLKQPYLSDAFFKMVQVAIDAAAGHGMVVHLYDELPYPSGAAGGEVLLGNPHFHATALVQQTFDVDGGEAVRIELPKGRILNCVACPILDDPQNPGLRSISDTGLGGLADWSRTIDLQSHVGVVLTEDSYQEVGLTSYNRKRYFSNVATPTLEVQLPPGRHRIFVSAQTTVENHKYYFHFVDTLNPAAVLEFLRLTHDRYCQRFGSQFGKVIRSIFADETAPTWSERLPGEFLSRRGYQLPPLLAALQDPRHPQHARVKADFHQVKYELFVEAFEKPYAKWCDEHGIAYWGEKPLLRLSQLKYSDVPGCDAGHVKIGAPLDMVSAELRANPRAAASATYFYGKPAALCECYHSLGWGATLADLKRLADGLLLAGINCFVPHAFFYSTHGLKKHDAPPSMFFQMPYWKFFGAMVKRTEHVLAEFEGTHIAARVLVVDPTPGVPSAEQSKAFVRLQHLLLESHVDYLLVDVDSLQTGRVEYGKLRIRDLAIELVIVPPMARMEAELTAWLDQFEKSGGKTSRCESDVLVLPEASLKFTGDSGQVHMVTRKDANRTLWFLQNTGNSAVDLQFESDELREFGLDTVARLAGNRRRLEGNESVLLQAGRDPHGLEAVVTGKVFLPLQMEVVPLNANLLPLREWQLTLDDQTALVRPAPVMHQLEKTGLRYSPKVDRAFGSVAQLRLPMLELHYKAQFENDFAGPLSLVIEPGSITGDCIIRINDDQSFLPATVDLHIRGSLGGDITHLLKPGTNDITVIVRTDRADGGLLNCLYLSGEFGVVRKDPGPGRTSDTGLFETLWCLCPRNPVGGFGQWEENGLPFFAGVVEYHAKTMIEDISAIIELAIDPALLGDDAMEISFNGGPWHAMLWSPRLVCPAAGELHIGENDIRLRVYTTLLRAFEGQRFDSESHRAVDVV